MVDHQQMVADGVKGIDVAAAEQTAGIGQCRALWLEDMVAQLLRLPDLGGGLSQPDLKRADPAKRL
jgi:hypothetical protein